MHAGATTGYGGKSASAENHLRVILTRISFEKPFSLQYAAGRKGTAVDPRNGCVFANNQNLKAASPSKTRSRLGSSRRGEARSTCAGEADSPLAANRYFQNFHHRAQS